jgi:hypothetical protein
MVGKEAGPPMVNGAPTHGDPFNSVEKFSASRTLLKTGTAYFMSFPSGLRPFGRARNKSCSMRTWKYAVVPSGRSLVHPLSRHAYEGPWSVGAGFMARPA